MFQRLTDRRQAIFKRLRGHGKLTEDEINTALREIRLALLEADVHYGVAKDFLNRVRERAVGREVLQSLTPGQQVVKIVFEELTLLLGGKSGAEAFADPSASPADMCQEAVRYARGRGLDPVLVDTRGRLHIDDDLMAELRAVPEG